jgi:hypothetical protein
MSYLSEERLTPGVIDGAAEHAFSQASLLGDCSETVDSPAEFTIKRSWERAIVDRCLQLSH